VPDGRASDAVLARVVDLAARVGLADDRNREDIIALVHRASALYDDPPQEALVGLVQAYARGVERIAAAEASLVARALATTPPEQLDDEIARRIEAAAPLSQETFAVVHRRRLEQFVRRRLAGGDPVAESEDDHEVADLGVALVDLHGSTSFMLERDPGVITSLVVELWAATSEVAARNGVHAGKFLGDGALLISADPDRLLAAAVDAVAELRDRTPLTAGAGVAFGPVVRHAGDWFGTPVNLAARLAELAGPDELVVDADAVPASVDVAVWREVTPRGLRDPRRVAVLTA